MGSVGYEEEEDMRIYEGGAETRSSLKRRVRRMKRRVLREQRNLSVDGRWISPYVANPWRWGRSGHGVREKGGGGSNDEVES
jgi:hypothetical protein